MAARAKVLVVGRLADARARLACAGAVARTLLNILCGICVMECCFREVLIGSVDGRR